jgi:hypothetical protein
LRRELTLRALRGETLIPREESFELDPLFRSGMPGEGNTGKEFLLTVSSRESDISIDAR